MRLNDERGLLVGGLVVQESDEVIAIKHSGQITRSGVSEVPVKGRDTMGVKFVGVRGDDLVSLIAINPENSVVSDENGTSESTDELSAGHDGASTTAPAVTDPAAEGVDSDEDNAAQAEEDKRE